MPARPPSSEIPIEVEVLEIDGQVPPPPVAADRTASGLMRQVAADDDRDAAATASGSPFVWHVPNLHLRSIHPLWWPFILVAGAVLLGLALTLGLAAFIGFVILRTLIRLLRALLS